MMGTGDGVMPNLDQFKINDQRSSSQNYQIIVKVIFPIGESSGSTAGL